MSTRSSSVLDKCCGHICRQNGNITAIGIDPFSVISYLLEEIKTLS